MRVYLIRPTPSKRNVQYFKQCARPFNFTTQGRFVCSSRCCAPVGA